MAISKIDGGWYVDIQPAGRGGKRYRKTLKTKAEALQWEAWVKTQVVRSEEWQPERRDTRKLLDLIESWYACHGAGLKAGANTYSRLKLACEKMGNPVADRFTSEAFAEYRKTRLAAGIAPNTVNREHAYLRSVFSELRRLGGWKKPNPMAEIRQYKIDEKERGYLQLDQIKKLLEALDQARNHHVKLIAKVCLSTGARWSEAEMLSIQHVRNEQIQFAGTKSGRVRVVPISPELAGELREHHNSELTGQRLFEPAYAAFRVAIEKSGLQLQEGQLTHILRHTFASHFMMRGGNILVLQRVLGHASLTMTMRYAHLAPDHLKEVLSFNPLKALTLG